MNDRDQWLAERRTGIGGSDAAGVFSEGYGCRRRLFYDKRGIEQDYQFDETLIMALGNLMEPFFAAKYEQKTERFLSLSQSRQHPEYPEARVNPDRLIFKSEAERTRYEGDKVPRGDFGVLEIKSQGFAVYSKTKREGLNPQYIWQLQHALFVTGAEWGSFQIGNRDSGASSHWDVPRNREMQQELETEIPKAWALITSDAPLPDRLPVEDFRCSECSWRVKCQGNSLVHVSGKSDLITAEDIRPMLAEYDASKVLFEEADARYDAAKEVLKTALEERPAVCLGGGDKDRKVYYRSQDGRSSWQSAELAKRYDKLRALAREMEALAGGDPAGVDEAFPPGDTFMRQGNPFRTLRVY